MCMDLGEFHCYDLLSMDEKNIFSYFRTAFEAIFSKIKSLNGTVLLKDNRLSRILPHQQICFTVLRIVELTRP